MAQYVMSMLHVSKVVPPKRQIIKDISLSFFPGAKIGLLGLNGSGKTTVLRIMAGADHEFEGEVQHLAGIRIGYLPQEPELDANKTVKEEVESGLGEIIEARSKLDAIYAAYAEPDADFLSDIFPKDVALVKYFQPGASMSTALAASSGTLAIYTRKGDDMFNYSDKNEMKAINKIVDSLKKNQ